jgi:hypothetical protein
MKMGKSKTKRRVKFIKTNARFIVLPPQVIEPEAAERGEVRLIHPSREDIAITTTEAAAHKQAERLVLQSMEEVSVYRLDHIITYKRSVSPK